MILENISQWFFKINSCFRHAIDNRSMQLALDHLRYTIPKHYFDEALSGGKPGDDDVIEMM